MLDEVYDLILVMFGNLVSNDIVGDLCPYFAGIMTFIVAAIVILIPVLLIWGFIKFIFRFVSHG